MGWDFAEYESKQDLINELKQDSTTYKKIKSSCVGRHFWQIEESTQTKEKIIVLYLLSKKGSWWGYKSMLESMHPYYYTCPLKFLKEVPPSNLEWREKVREFHRQKSEARKRKIEVGATYAVKGYTHMFCRITRDSIRGKFLCEIYGATYGIRKSQIGEKVKDKDTCLA